MKISKIVIAFLAVFLLLTIQVKAADITLTDVNVDKTGYLPGEEVTLSFKVTNTHATETRVVSVKSSDLVISGTGYKISMTQVVSLNIAPGASSTGQIKATVPATLTGSYSATLTAISSVPTDGTNKAEKTYSVVVQPKSEVKIENQDFSVAPGKTNTVKKFTAKNTGSIPVTFDVNAFSFDSNNFKDSENDQIILTYPNMGVLNPGDSKTFELKVTVPRDQESKVYTGVINVKDYLNNPIVSLTLNLNIKPEICVAGNVGSDLDLDVEDPDDGDEFNPGDTVRVRFNVDNNANDDIDVEVEAILYDTVDNDEIDSFDDSDTIDEDDDITFEFEVPLDTDLKDSSSRYKIFVKAFEDGDEDINCQEDVIDIEVKRETHQVTLDDFSLLPSAVNCGDTVRASVTATNTGKSNERNLRLELFSLSLGDLITKTTDVFELDEDDDAIKDFSFVVPKDTPSGEYVVEVEPIISGSASKNAAAVLKVTCNEVTGEPIGASQQELDLVQNARDLLASKDYSQALSVLSIAEDLRAGEQYSSLKQQINDAKTGSTGTPVTGNGYLPTSSISGLFGSSKNAAVFWIIGDIVLVVIALYFIKLIFTRKQK